MPTGRRTLVLDGIALAGTGTDRGGGLPLFLVKSRVTSWGVLGPEVVQLIVSASADGIPAVDALGGPRWAGARAPAPHNALPAADADLAVDSADVHRATALLAIARGDDRFGLTSSRVRWRALTLS